MCGRCRRVTAEAHRWAPQSGLGRRGGMPERDRVGHPEGEQGGNQGFPKSLDRPSRSGFVTLRYPYRAAICLSPETWGCHPERSEGSPLSWQCCSLLSKFLSSCPYRVAICLSPETCLPECHPERSEGSPLDIYGDPALASGWTTHRKFLSRVLPKGLCSRERGSFDLSTGLRMTDSPTMEKPWQGGKGASTTCKATPRRYRRHIAKMHGQDSVGQPPRTGSVESLEAGPVV